MRKRKHKLNNGEIVARAQHGSIVGLTPKMKGTYFNIKDSKVERRRSFSFLKNILEFPELCRAADYIEKTVHPSQRRPLYGLPLPKSYEQLGNFYEYNISENVLAELNWTLLGIRKFSYEIELFVYYKELYEKYFLIGDFGNAEKYLTKIEEEVCFSMWTLENRFLIKEYTDSSTDNKQFLTNFNKQNVSLGVTKSLAHYLSIRAEKTLSVNRFNTDLDSALQKLIGSDLQGHRDFYRFQLSFLNHNRFKNIADIIGINFPHSIIDRYLAIRKVFSLLLIEANNFEDKEDEESLKQYILSRVEYLKGKINDTILDKIYILSSNGVDLNFQNYRDDTLISILDKYTSGAYGEVVSDLKQTLLDNPTQFDLYEIYVKSLIYQNKGFEAVSSVNSIQNTILNEMYKILSVSFDPKDSSLNLMRISNNLSSCILSYGILDFVQNQRKGKTERKLLARLSFSLSNPNLHEVFNDKFDQTNFLESLGKVYTDSITVNFLTAKLNGSNLICEFQSIIPDVKYKVAYAKSLQDEKLFDQAIEVWKYLIGKYGDTKPILESAVRNLFICYENEEKYDECIKLYVDSYFSNIYIVEKIEVSDIQKKIRENKFKIVEPTIDLPLFYTISNADENETHITFERFNISNGIIKPTELFDRFYEFDNNKIIYFLRYTCGPEIIKHSIHIRGSKERLEERLSVCQYLKDKDSDAKSYYEDEIKQISNILVIQKGLLELDESKIYVNEAGIISNELKDYEAVFQRFKTIAGITDKGKVLLLGSDGKLTTLAYTAERTTAEKIEYSSNPVFDIYKELFLAIKEKFLHSKFGIVAYLSTRIRHGVLLGEIRPVFEKHKLITLKEGESAVYKTNFHWMNAYCTESNWTHEKIQNLLHDFSAKVDGLIFDLIKKYLQVYDEELNPDGWFDYEFDDNDLFWLSIAAINYSDFSQFSYNVFEVLWERTDENLKKIRDKIQNEISNEFNLLFDNLENDISEILGVGKSQSLIGAIKLCSTEIQTVINKVSSWFKRSGANASDFQLNSLIDIVMEYTNKAFQNRKINLIRQIEYDCRIKGEYLTHFADLLRIFTENIIKHSDEKVNTINAIISARLQESELLIIKIENEITNPESLSALKDVWTGGEIDIRKLSSEKKSGYHKAEKILKSDLKGDQNILETEINNEENTFSVIMKIHLKALLA